MRTYNGIERPDFTPEQISELKADEVFVFGSNLEGMHGGGAAFYAWKHFGAVMGCGVGLRKSIPTIARMATGATPRALTTLLFLTNRCSGAVMGPKDGTIAAKHGKNARAVSAYPACIAFIYGQARMRYNDEEYSP